MFPAGRSLFAGGSLLLGTYLLAVWYLRDAVSPQTRHFLLLQPMFLGVCGMLTYYAWARLVRACHFDAPTHTWATRGLVVFFLTAIAGFPVNAACASPHPHP